MDGKREQVRRGEATPVKKVQSMGGGRGEKGVVVIL